MSELTRDHLADALATMRAESTSLADVRVEMAALNGTVGVLAEAVRLQVAALETAQRQSDLSDADMNRRVSKVEQAQWRVAGGIGVLGILAGGFGSTIAERLFA